MADNILLKHVNETERDFFWRLVARRETPAGTSYSLELASQRWRGMIWKHQLWILVPRRLRHKDCALLLIRGGSTEARSREPCGADNCMASRLGGVLGATVAAVSQVPNQPLFGGLVEDALVAYTFDRFLATRDTTWPLLLPMTKTAVKAMDAVQQFALEELNLTIQHFVVAGASKRGWTTWLTGAADPRVKAVAPMVIDMLNIKEQMPYQKKVWGAYSREIDDYTRYELQNRINSTAGEELLRIVDPFSYRERLTVPKLILIGTNDTYWPVDAANLYFDELIGEKHILYVPNAGHGLGDGQEAIAGIAGLFEHAGSNTPLPAFSWHVTDNDKQVRLIIDARERPLEVNLWSAHANMRDFRHSKWSKRRVSRTTADTYEITVDIPSQGYTAFYGELVFSRLIGGTYSLCTNVRVLDSERCRHSSSNSQRSVRSRTG